MQEQSVGFWLSPQQELAWLLQQNAFGFGSGPTCLISLSGSLDVNQLRSALQLIARRHEILRTVFRRQPGMKFPLQTVVENLEIGWRESDLAGLSATACDTAVRALWEEASTWESGFELGPALNATLAKFGPPRFALILSVNPLCADAQSLQIIARELEQIYFAGGDPPEPFRYVQFAQWQADLLDSQEEDAKKGKAFWAKQTESITTVSLPNEAKASETSKFDLQSIFRQLNPQLASKLASQRSAEFLLASWECLLSRLSARNAFTIGYLADSREYEELENAIGCFARTLPIAARIENDFRFGDVPRQTTTALSEAVAVQEYFSPKSIGADRELVSFAYHELKPEQSHADVVFRLDRIFALNGAHKLRLVVVRCGTELRLEFQYDASRLTRSAVERIAGYYQNLLAAALANPETLVSQLPLLSEAERQQLVVDWNRTAAEYPHQLCVQELFEQQAARTPERIAVRSPQHAYSYRQLNECANQLAHYLRAQGVGPDRPVGLCLERSAEIMVAVLAILKAGGAYVPLNPDNPAARLEQQLEGAAVVITESQLVGHIPDGAYPVLALDRDAWRWADQPKSNPALQTTPENPVYILYTSGSTGVPKGVCVRHRNLVNYAHFITQRLELDKHPQGLQFATVSTLSADLGNTCIYPGLISGGTLHILPYEMATDPQRFAAYAVEHPIDVLKIVPSHLQALLQSEEAAKLLPRKYLILGGETLVPKLVAKVEALNPGCEILNHYGPTETTVGSLTLKLNEYDWKSAKLASIPIGRPIANTQVYILDQNLEPVPIGVTGELYIAGAGVSAGYVGQPEKTAERFVRNPFATEGNSPMYRTGDLARYGEDGNIEFLGRGDDQVKVRGFRIELGEIEAALARHSAVKQAVALARENENGDKRLLAYVVVGRDSAGANGHSSTVTGEELRTHLKQHVPDYMLPQAVMILPKLPLTANGKIDRQALPEPDQAQAKAYVAPRTPTEQVIAQIWTEVLRRPADSISIDDNFFDLGGHSLMATQVVSRLRQQFAVEIPMRVMFDQSSISGLAVAVEQALEAAAQTDDFAIARVSREAYRM